MFSDPEGEVVRFRLRSTQRLKNEHTKSYCEKEGGGLPSDELYAGVSFALTKLPAQCQ